MEKFDGKKIRDDILLGIRKDIIEHNRDMKLAVFLIGDDPVCKKYVELKKSIAEKLGITFCLYEIENQDSEEKVIECIEYLNNDAETQGIMIQIPIPDKYSRNKLIEAISPHKDIDGLRYCMGIESDFKPPVVLAILKALEDSKKDLFKSEILVIGKGFLVGTPLMRALKESDIKFQAVDQSDKNIFSDLKEYDIIISATGQANLIRPEAIKEGVILIDAGTTEQNGTLVGDIDPECYPEASFYTPVPGGIGPVTIAMLFRNLTEN